MDNNAVVELVGRCKKLVEELLNEGKIDSTAARNYWKTLAALKGEGEAVAYWIDEPSGRGQHLTFSKDEAYGTTGLLKGYTNVHSLYLHPHAESQSYGASRNDALTEALRQTVEETKKLKDGFAASKGKS
jgi:hypothetical protein